MGLSPIGGWWMGAALAVALAAPVVAASSGTGAPDWWSPGEGKRMPAEAAYDNPYGKLTVLNTTGPIETAGHPFFTPLGANGRACVTCHQPSDGMSVSAAHIQARWLETKGKDPLFAAVDGSNCPALPQDKRASHSLLLDHGLFRIFVPWPPKNADGSSLNPDFSIEVVRDPTGCNTDKTYGLKSANPMVSVFRRPRPAVNTKYLTTPDSIAGFNAKTGMPFARDPETGAFVSQELMADGRTLTLKTQAVDAGLSHLETAAPLSPAQLNAIVAFETQVYAAQSASSIGGAFAATGAPPGLGALAMAKGRPGILGNDLKTPVFQSFEVWRPKPGGPTDAGAAFRASVVRGADLYMTKTFWIRDSAHLNTVGLGNPIKRTCSTCHNAQMTGMDVAPGWMDIGTNNLPTADPLAHLPLFKVTCRKDAYPHPFLGRVIYTHDPGRALTTGKCDDVGSITMQQFRGLAARAPYFANGSAKDLMALIVYYDRRYEMKLTDQEKQDFVNFMSVL